MPQRLDLWLMPSYSSVIYHHLRAGELAQALCTFEASPFLDLSSTFPGAFLQVAGDEEELDLDALRAETRREMAAGAFTLSKNASLVADIIADFARTHDDKEFAMKTRFFPSGVKIPGVKWTD